MRTPARLTLLCLLALAGLVLPAQAAAGTAALYNDYTQDGGIDGCKYSSSQINGALGSIPTDVAQYDPGFKDALNKAAGEDCTEGRGSGGAGGGAAGGASGEGQAYAPDGSTRPPNLVAGEADLANRATPDLSSDRNLPTALIVLGVLVALILLGTGGLALARGGSGPLAPGGGGSGRVSDTLSDYYWALRDRVGR